MSAKQIVAALLVLVMMVGGPGLVGTGSAQPVAAVPPPPGGAPDPAQPTEPTPPRVSYIHGEASFWRPGAQDWTPAQVNTPLAPGDLLYSGPGGLVEIQIGPRAFVRAAEGTQIGLDNQEPDFIQLRMTGGHAALDVRQLAPGSILELDTPSAAFTIERAGYFSVDVNQDSTTFGTHRAGSATMTTPEGGATHIATDQQVVVTGTSSPQVALGAAAPLTEWDRWNYQRTNYVLQSATASSYVPPAVYGAEALNQYGSWRTAETYGPVWVPAGVPAGWVPYSTGRWIWDPRFGWTWLDDAPWGWAPYHYGRWVFVGNYWAWAPGPVVARPVYAPALVVFLGGVTVSVGQPLYWAPLGWGEPVIPWWGRPGFVGVPWWGGWGGPRVVNNVVINRTTTVNVTNITVYKNVNVTNAVVGVPAHQFGHAKAQVVRISQAQVQQLQPVRGALSVKPVAASVTLATGPAAQPPAAMHARPVVATRAPKDLTPTLQTHGLSATTPQTGPQPAPQLVPAPKRATRPASPTVAPAPGPGVASPTTPSTIGAGPGPQQKRGGAQPPGQSAARPPAQFPRQPAAQPPAQPPGQPAARPPAQFPGQPAAQPPAQPPGQPAARPPAQFPGQPAAQPPAQPPGQPAARPPAQFPGQPAARPPAQPPGQPAARPPAQFPGQPAAQPSPPPPPAAGKAGPHQREAITPGPRNVQPPTPQQGGPQQGGATIPEPRRGGVEQPALPLPGQEKGGPHQRQ